MRQHLVRLALVAALLAPTALTLQACSRPVTIESVQQDVATNGTKLLQATRVIQDAIYGGVKDGAIPPQRGIELLDVTQTIGERGQAVAANLDRVDRILAAGGAVDGPLIAQLTTGLAEMAKEYPQLVVPGIPARVSQAVAEAQALIATLQATVAKLRAQ